MDDDADLRMIYKTHLELEGYEVHAADNGLTALTLLRLQDYVVIVSDINMPFMNGLLLLAQLKAEFPNLPMILLTGIAMKTEADTAQRFGVSAVLAKPFPLQQLALAVASAVGRSKKY